ncbi:MAG: orotidine-5'-phosphate decarboxylase [bacterium]
MNSATGQNGHSENKKQNIKIMVNNPKHDPLIVALDVPCWDKARNLVRDLGNQVGYYKVGLQLFVRCGPRIVQHLKDLNKKVFLDLKFKDIPNTVSESVASAARIGATMCNIHLDGTRPMIHAAVESGFAHKITILGVTVLTSVKEDNDLREIGVNFFDTNFFIQKQVMLLASLAKDEEVQGLVCGAPQISSLKDRFGDFFTLVVPGTRSKGVATNDQNQVMTPEEAIATFRGNPDYLVIGREVTRPANGTPLQALMSLRERLDLEI